MFDITQLLFDLAEERSIFHSEADLQHALALKVREAGSDVRLEFPYQGTGTDRRYLDIWLPQEGIAIELKYHTRKLEVTVGGESFALRDQGAQDIRRYDFLKDIQRIEHACQLWDDCNRGLAILLTNDHTLWQRAKRTTTVDAQFRLHENRVIRGTLQWSDEASEGTKRSRESDIKVQGDYQITWRDFSNPAAGKYGRFRYLLIGVPAQ